MILDTNAVSAAVDKDDALLSLVRLHGRPYLPIHVIGEYQFGLLGSRLRKSIEPFFVQLKSQSIILAADLETAKEYATLRHELKLRGRPIPENDLWIASLARQHGLPIASRDERHFDGLEGVTRLGW
ncbi:PIN domain-containing protein [Pseudobythopirellula maris]|uniref:PIN domain-containing protein n=1 Tax=Pseudobythopirellula maris TaxID=2527991 RepID=UPI0018D3E2B5|nr:PIN domain-containing protein [Pseudobythopirellula maris]